jgi:zinc and cadmium transporter
MITILIITVIATSVGTILLASLVLKLNDQLLGNTLKYINAFAGGLLLAAAFIGLLPEAFSLAPAKYISYTVLVVISFFIILEKLMHAPHDANKKEASIIQPGATTLLLGSAIHSLLDGIVIVTAFFNSISLGLMVASAIFIHEIPRQVTNLGIMLRLKHSKRSAFRYNAAAGAAMIAGGLLAYSFNHNILPLLPYLFSFAAGSFMYVSLSVLIPGLQKTVNLRQTFYQLVLFLLAILIVLLSVWYGE